MCYWRTVIVLSDHPRWMFKKNLIEFPIVFCTLLILLLHGLCTKVLQSHVFLECSYHKWPLTDLWLVDWIFEKLKKVKLDKQQMMLLSLRSNSQTVTNFIWSYLHQIFDDSHGLKASLKPLRRPFDRCQSRLEAINIGRDNKQINW